MTTEIIQHRSTTGERLTPRWIVDLCAEVMGGIDLDPCAESGGPPWNVPATVHYTEDDDCLTREWRGRVFLNPPYGRHRGCDDILEKLLAEHAAGRVTEALVLLKVDPSTRWWQILGRRWSWLAFNRRIRFDGMATGAGFASALFYVGHVHEAEFREVFWDHGTVYKPWRNKPAVIYGR